MLKSDERLVQLVFIGDGKSIIFETIQVWVKMHRKPISCVSSKHLMDFFDGWHLLAKSFNEIATCHSYTKKSRIDKTIKTWMCKEKVNWRTREALNMKAYWAKLLSFAY